LTISPLLWETPKDLLSSRFTCQRATGNVLHPRQIIEQSLQLTVFY